MSCPGWVRVVLAVLVLALVVVGCGGASRSAKPGRVLDERQYVRQVDAICAGSAQALNRTPTADAAGLADRLRTVMRVIERDLSQVARLRTPASIAVHVQQAVASAGAARSIYAEALRDVMRIKDPRTPVSPADVSWRRFERGNAAESKAAVSWAVAGVELSCAPEV